MRYRGWFATLSPVIIGLLIGRAILTEVRLKKLETAVARYKLTPRA